MKKLALILALSFVVPVITTTMAGTAAAYDDLAIGDPLSRGQHRKKKAKPAAEKSDNPLGGVPVEASGPRAKTTTPPDSPQAEKPAEKAPSK